MHDLIDDHLGQWCRERSADEIVQALWESGIPVSSVMLPDELVDNPQLASRGWWSTVAHPIGGDEIHNGYPVSFSAGPTSPHRRHAPLLGEHNREVLGGLLGVSEEEMSKLEADEVIGTRPSGTKPANIDTSV